jgi:hypothetical protein
MVMFLIGEFFIGIFFKRVRVCNKLSVYHMNMVKQ